VIDSSDVARMDIVKKEIEVLLQEEELKGAALLVFANKQDVKGALSEGEIAEKLELAKKCKERYEWMGMRLILETGVYGLVVRSRKKD
jgi:signal recognition particle receptor subunit beta